jgi:hypothetical protein
MCLRLARISGNAGDAQTYETRCEEQPFAQGLPSRSAHQFKRLPAERQGSQKAFPWA